MKKRPGTIKELKGIVKSDKHRWDDDAFDSAIDAALAALSDDRPVSTTISIKLASNKRVYPLPDDCHQYLGSTWGLDEDIDPWDKRYPGALPHNYDSDTRTGGKQLEFSFAPRPKHLAAYGEMFECWYGVKHIIDDVDNTIRKDDWELFITRALAALMKDLIAANVTNPVQLHRGMGSVSNSATPVTAHKQLMNHYKDLVNND